jgi:hypothetical protein
MRKDPASAESPVVDVPLRWIDETAPADLPLGATLGAPLPRGEVASTSQLCLLDADGVSATAQFWSLATWPDGTVKWAGVALPANAGPAPAYRVRVGENPPPATPVTVATNEDGYTVDSGALSVVIPSSGSEVFRTVSLDGRVVAESGRLISTRQKSSEPDPASRTHSVGIVSSVDVEQDGPVRAVVTVRGTHVDADGRSWLPFTLRFVFIAGATAFRVVHTFVYDGDPDSDFLSSLGITVDVPLDGHAHDRHVRFAGAEGGVLGEAVQGITGLWMDPGSDLRTAQTSGGATPPLDQWPSRFSERLRYVPTWPDYTLRQHSPRAFHVSKRTAADRPWIDVAHGGRAAGYATLTTPSGGIGVGLKDFWQSYPAGFDVRNGDTQTATLTLWLWTPDAPPMDLRFYHDGLEQDTYREQLTGLEITYEDYETGLGSALGISRTHEIDIVAYSHTPTHEHIAAHAAHVQTQPRLSPTPAALQAAHAFGDWDLESRETLSRAKLEDRLTQILDFYLGQVDQRDWYGFWNYGDVMHSYDADRHVWRYDIGGYAWDNSELASDLWLWTSFARSGRADVFRMAEAMARHTGDVDSYHAGPYKGLGSRHNVQHWGCGCKQLRIGSPAFRRPHYYLTADEHSRDLMVELRDSDRTFLALDPSRKGRPDVSPPLPPNPVDLPISLGPDWGTLAATWLADWEITGNTRSRDRLLGTMADIAALPFGFLNGHLRYDLEEGRIAGADGEPHLWHLTAIFGLVEICSELIELVDVPGFRDAWVQYCRIYLATPEEQRAEVGRELPGNNFPQWHSRLLAYAAVVLGDDDASDRAWTAFYSGGEVTKVELGPLRRINPPTVLQPVDELTISTNDAAQSSLATIQNLALIGHRLP